MSKGITAYPLTLRKDRRQIHVPGDIVYRIIRVHVDDIAILGPAHKPVALDRHGRYCGASLVVKAVSKQDSRYSATALVTLQKPSCQVQIKASPDNAGTVTESRSVDYGGSITLEASAKDGR